ncbi:MAG: hypothetical protein M9931_06240 [Chitinophagales bacterium]|nr:hypothetical protein [Chitinophagales bacterium]
MDNNNRVAINNGATADANSNLYVNRPSGDYGAGKAAFIPTELEQAERLMAAQVGAALV